MIVIVRFFKGNIKSGEDILEFLTANLYQCIYTHASEPLWCVLRVDFCLSLLEMSELRQAVIFEVWQATCNYKLTVDFNTRKIPSMLQACSSFLNPFFFLTPISFHHIVSQAFDTLKTPVRCFGTQDTLKKVLCLSISQAILSSKL